MMRSHVFAIWVLILAMESECSRDNGFFISAPKVFRVGVKEKVFVQMSQLNVPVTIHLEHQGTLLSAPVPTQCTKPGETQIVELMIDRHLFERLPNKIAHVWLVAKSPAIKRHSTMVLVSKRSGHIFIQTDQPIYNPTQRVRYRVFTLDHTFRPNERVFQITVVNAAGNKIMKTLKTAKGGIFKGWFPIPDISKMGTWKITANYKEDEAISASREFRIQKFVLPSFEVNVELKKRYILLNAAQLNFTITAKYSYGEKVRGAYHCQFGVVQKDEGTGQKKKPAFIKGLELTGSINEDPAAVSLQIENLKAQLLQHHNQTLSMLQEKGAQLYLGVFVTNIQSGEIQEAEVYIPIISHTYTLDLSRTRSHFIPGYPLDVVVVVRLPDGAPAAGVQVDINVPSSSEPHWQGPTDQQGAVFPVFNLPMAQQITVEVSAGDQNQRKVIQRASSPSGSYLFLSFDHRMYSVGELLTVTYNTVNAPMQGFIYYMVLSRGIIIKQGSVQLGTTARHSERITSDMVPSFRLIGYYYDQHGNVIADSVWVDVSDECEIEVKVEHRGQYEPGRKAELNFDLNGQKARVALLAVDKAIYALNADNKLRAKQVFSTMGSNDLGCSFTGGADPASVLTEAGLSYVSHSGWRRGTACVSQSARGRRSVDLQQELLTLKSNITDEKLKDCCAQGFSLIPMTRTCEERAKRVALVQALPACADTFLKCCLEGERLRQKKIKQDARKELGRTASIADIEDFFLDTAQQYIRQYFPPSFSFTEFDINGKGRFDLTLPDSITTWEIQVITVSPATGFCVVTPTELRAFKSTFVSLRLPYSVKKYEQLSISPVIYNYGTEAKQIAVHMEQTEGLCSPASATTTAFVNITVGAESSQYVSFSTVPMVTGSLPIKIRLYDMENEYGVDAVQKTLNVLNEGLEQRVEETQVIKLDGKSSKTLNIDGSLPDETIPEFSSSIFISMEGDGFHNSHMRKLVDPKKIAKLIVLPTGCLEQTMTGLVPTASAIRYLDLSEKWFEVPDISRDDALDNLEKGFMRILQMHGNQDGSYGSWGGASYSNWVTALVVKVLSQVAERQTMVFGEQSRQARLVPLEKISQSVRYLLSGQKTDGSFSDPNPVLHRGILTGEDQVSSLTAFITLALQLSLKFLNNGLKNEAEASISRATTYLASHFEELQHPHAVSITAYCLAVCLPEGTDHSSAWTKLQSLTAEGNDECHLWGANANLQTTQRADGITVTAASYALLAAVKLGKINWADKTACWLSTQENNLGGFYSSRDTIVALEALAEYELKRATIPEANLMAEFTSPTKKDIVRLHLENKMEKVETDLKKLSGNNIIAQLTGKGAAKLKVVKAYYLLEPKDVCSDVSISVTVEGKVKYTAKVIDNYEYYEDYNADDSDVFPRSTIDLFDARTRYKRNVDNDVNSDEKVTYRVCVSHSLSRNLSGMGIADITLLSGFEAVTQDLDRLKEEPEQYISHYEVSYGRVLLYFNELYDSEECISFDAIQIVPIGLLQPAPAMFYDYYEPSKSCTVFYSAPKRSKMVSKLCSPDVCQCAERPCHKIKNTFRSERGQPVKRNDRTEHACFFPTVDYAYIVEVLNVSLKSSFELFKVNVQDVLKSHGDITVAETSVRMFAQRQHCKGQLELGRQYLIMGKDGITKDSNGQMQYLLESNTWVERMPLEDECKKSAHQIACRHLNAFINSYKIDGCRQ